MMTTIEMKKIMSNKFKDENCYFRFKDISIKKIKPNEYNIVIKDYESILFKMSFNYDDFFGFEVWLTKYYKEGSLFVYDNIINCIDSKKDYDVKLALINLAYYISDRF